MSERSAFYGGYQVECPVSVHHDCAPDSAAIITQDESVCFGRLESLVNNVARNLRKLEPDATRRLVGFRVPVDVDACATLLGLLRMGDIVCILDPKAPDAYAQARCTEVGACVNILPEDITGLTRASEVFMLTSDGPYWYSVDDPALIIFTSGSTGRPKAAVLSMGNVLAAARQANINMPLGPGDGWLLSLGIHHVAGLGILFRCWSAGAAVVIAPQEATLAEAIMNPRVTHLSLVPTQLHRLMESEACTGRLAAMKGILLGGAPAPESLIRRAYEAGLPIHTSYGMTETCAQICATPPGASLDQLLTSGWPLGPGAVRISPEGEIEVGGPTRFLGYWEEGRLLQPFTEDGWFRTGDLGSFNADECLRVTGRRDHMFLAGGENIQPEEVEAALCALPGVAEAVVVPLPHEAFGTTPAAFVRMTDGSAPDGEALRAALLETLPKFKVPRHWFPWPEDLAQGMKVNRKALAERVRSAGFSP